MTYYYLFITSHLNEYLIKLKLKYADVKAVLTKHFKALENPVAEQIKMSRMKQPKKPSKVRITADARMKNEAIISRRISMPATEEIM